MKTPHMSRELFVFPLVSSSHCLSKSTPTNFSVAAQNFLFVIFTESVSSDLELGDFSLLNFRSSSVGNFEEKFQHCFSVVNLC